MMKTLIIALVISICAVWGVVQACEIANAKEVEVGLSKGFEGQCSNNGKNVKCTYQKGEGWTCEGPEGRYNKLDEELTQQLIGEACGCFSHLQS